MKRLFTFFALLFATSAMAVDWIQPCVGNSCKMILEPRNSSGIAQLEFQLDGHGALAMGTTNSTDPLEAYTFNLPSASAGATASPSTVQGFIKYVNGSSSGSQPNFVMNAGASSGASNNTVVNGYTPDSTTAGDMQFSVANNASGSFGTSYTTLTNKAFDWFATGTGDIGNASRAGLWLFGPSNQQVKMGAVGQTASSGGVAEIGSPNGTVNAGSGGGTATFRIGNGSSNSATCMMQSGSNNSVLFMVGNATVNLITQIGTEFVTGAPSSSQLQITYANTNSVVTLTSGSGAGHSLSITCMAAAL